MGLGRLDEEYLYKKTLCNKCKKNIEDLDHLGLDTLNLSVRLHNALRLNRIYTVGDLFNKSIKDVVYMRYIGEKSAKEIIEKIFSMNIVKKHIA